MGGLDTTNNATGVEERANCNVLDIDGVLLRRQLIDPSGMVYWPRPHNL